MIRHTTHTCDTICLVSLLLNACLEKQILIYEETYTHVVLPQFFNNSTTAHLSVFSVHIRRKHGCCTQHAYNFRPSNCDGTANKKHPFAAAGNVCSSGGL